MRFIIQEKNLQRSPLVFIGGIDAPEIGIQIIENGVTGWYNTPAIQEEVQDITARDGGRTPLYKTQGSRTVGIAFCIIAESSIELGKQIDEIYSFVGKDLILTCEDEFGTRSAECYISSEVELQPHYSEQHALGAITLTCPDPHKYGRKVAIDFAGQLTIPNDGNIDLYPTLELESIDGSNMTSISIECDGRQLVWSGDANAVILDTKAMSASSGRFTKPVKVPVKQGGADYKTTTYPCNAKGKVYLQPSWR